MLTKKCNINGIKSDIPLLKSVIICFEVFYVEHVLVITSIILWDFKFSRWRVWSSGLSSGILHGSTSQKTILNSYYFVRAFVSNFLKKNFQCHIPLFTKIMQTAFLTTHLRTVRDLHMGKVFSYVSQIRLCICSMTLESMIYHTAVWK
jgi:hypothetical protein